LPLGYGVPLSRPVSNVEPQAVRLWTPQQDRNAIGNATPAASDIEYLDDPVALTTLLFPQGIQL
jgi:hypothetical protein